MKDAAEKFKEKSPAPMNEMLQKEPRDVALKKKDDRSKMTLKDVPPTTTRYILSYFYILYL